MKKTLSIILALTMLLTMSNVFVFADTPAVALPTATITKLDVTEMTDPALTFAMNFKANEATAEQREAYGSWYADFVFTVNKDVTFNASGEADGYLAGQYEAWSESWVPIPFEDTEIEADKPVKIMEIAAAAMGQPGLKYTYAEVYNVVKDFDCGVYFSDEFLKANPDVEATLELRIYNNNNEEESYRIGDLYAFSVEMPTATISKLDVTEMTDPALTFAMNFKADKTTAAQLAVYGDWYADFVFTVNKDVTFNASGEADGYLAGQYEAWSESWVPIPFEDTEIEADKPVKIMEIAAAAMGQSGLKYTYAEVYNVVKDFDCGVYFDDEFLIDNSGLKATLELRLYNPENEEESYRIGETYSFMNPIVKDEITNVIVEGSKVADTTVEIADINTGSAEDGTTNVTIDTNAFVDGADVIDTVKLPAAAITAVESLGEDATLNITLANGEDADVEVSINKEALAVIKDAANDAGEDVILKVEQTDELADAQNNTLADLDNGVVYRVSLETEGGAPIYAETGAEDGRNIEIKIYYSKSSTGKVLVRVKHLKDDGTLEDVDFRYDENIVTMNLAHFSEYVIYETRISSGITTTGSGAAASKYTVTFDTDGGSAVASQRVEKNDKVSEPAAPTKEGYTFDGWYTDDAFETAYDFEAAVTKAFTLYAKWAEVAEKPAEDEPSADEPSEAVAFADVKENDWFSEDVKFVSEKGLMNGVTETEFAPDTLLTRAMLVTILYRNEGEPATNRSIPFDDIDMGAYYASAVIWAQQNGIVNGVTETEFAPDANITREQIAAIMFRYAVYKGMDAVTVEENLAAFADADEINEYAISALNWAVGSGLINGKTESTLCPKDNATRAEIAAILHRYIDSQK